LAFAGLVDAGVLGGILCLFFLAAARLSVKAPAALLARYDNWQSLVVPGLALLALLAVVYGTAFGVTGRTPGRLLAGLKLVDKTGLSPTPIRAIFRAVFSLVSVGLFLSGFWLALFDRRSQTLHDKLTSTFVVRLVS
jgi:uncharacterized RDD family membrane protein YckC